MAGVKEALTGWLAMRSLKPIVGNCYILNFHDAPPVEITEHWARVRMTLEYPVSAEQITPAEAATLDRD